MKAILQTRYTVRPTVKVFVGTGNYKLDLQGQFDQTAEAIKLISSKPKLAAIAAQDGFIVREDRTSSLGHSISAAAYNQHVANNK